MLKQDVVFLSGVRTPFGAFGGSLKDFSATDLGVLSSQAAIEKSGLKPAELQHVIFGNVLQTSPDAIYLARHIGLKSNLFKHVPALTVNRLCGSGFEAIIQSARMINQSEIDCALVGGTESMSQAPYVVRGARWGVRLNHSKMEDFLWESLRDAYCSCEMGMTAENLAEKYKLSREEVDEYALTSQTRANKAWNSGKMLEEIVPVKIQNRKETIVFERDEHLRPDTTMASLGKLPPFFKEGGTVTAGNASGMVDGAAALIISSKEKANQSDLKPIGKLLSWGTVGVDPVIMGIGPVKASKIALKNAGLQLDDMDLVEINEAFSSQYLAVEKALELDRSKTNVNGGSIAIGHPLGATGARLTLTLLHELRRQKKQYGLASACIGGGQGLALVIEAFKD